MVPLQISARPKMTARAMRAAGKIPCVLYGNNVPNTLLSCEEGAIRKAYLKAGASTLVELEHDGKKIPVLFQSLSQDPVTDRFEHVDFYAVDMTKEVEARVPIRLDGESPAVKNLAAILVTPLDHVTVRCLPSRLPHELTASINGLAEYHSSLTIADLHLPEGVTILENATAVIATVQEQRAEEVEVAPVVAEGAEAVAGAPAAEGAPGETAEAKPAGKE